MSGLPIPRRARGRVRLPRLALHHSPSSEQPRPLAMVAAHPSAIRESSPPRPRRVLKPTRQHSSTPSSRDYEAIHTVESISEGDTDHCSRSGSSDHASDSDTSEADIPSYHRRSSSPGMPPQSRMNTAAPKLLHRESGQRQDEERSPTKAWYQFDFAVLVALVPPIGHWLTGGDHLKNIFFIVLLIYYLHQVIEVPWNLYQKARHRRRHPQLPPIASEDKQRDLAVSELRKLELLFLLLTTFSPFLGAYLLRYATQLIMGPEAISWFSTALFVMAAGMRPWSHLSERLSRRTVDLQDYIRYPPTPDHKHMQDQIDVLNNRLQGLEDTVLKLQSRLRGTTDEMFDYMDDTVDVVERAMRKYEKKVDKQENRLKLVEVSLLEKGKLTAKNTQPSLLFLQRFLPVWSYLNSGESPRGSDYSPTPHRDIVLNGSVATISSASLLDRSLGFASSVAHDAAYVATTPLRVALRMIFGKN